VWIPGPCGNACIGVDWTGGIAFLDVNLNGTFDPGDQPVVGQSVVIGDSRGSARSTKTGAHGEFYFGVQRDEEYLVVLGESETTVAEVSPRNGYSFRVSESGEVPKTLMFRLTPRSSQSSTNN
jgi:SdrD B-like domain